MTMSATISASRSRTPTDAPTAVPTTFPCDACDSPTTIINYTINYTTALNWHTPP